ncbi:MAG: hypothetical protein JO062_02070 [Bryobacterales bacterium]|nr:hypothetical protein [Bryobacterales bacterium]
MVRAEEETDKAESKGARYHWIARYRGNRSGRPDLYQHVSTVITSAGDYLLSADLICAGGDGITINTSNARLALEGHTITAGEGANRAIVASTQTGALQNIQILGPGLITNGGANTFSVGVFLDFLLNSEVSGITVRGSSGSGIAAGDCSFLTVTANTLGRNSVGLSLADPKETRFRKMT